MHIYHDSHNTEYRYPFGAAECGAPIDLKIDAPWSYAVDLVLRRDGFPEQVISGEPDNYGVFSWRINAPSEDCLLWYFFVIHYDGLAVCYGNTPAALGGAGQIYRHGETPVPYQISVYHPFSVPEWYSRGIAYSIFPDRFCRSGKTPDCGRHMEEWNTAPYYIRNEDNSIKEWNFWGGDLKGITEKLPYIASLGASIIYLNPIFAARSNHRYDTADYFRIDPLLGTEEDFRKLCAKAKELDIRIILDGVFNHTGVDSKYFREHPDWYIKDGEGIKCWWGVKDLPEVDENNPEFAEMICGKDGVLRYWLRAGASGWRLDVADELPDAFIRAIRKAVKEEDPNAVLIGEVWEDASNKTDYGVRMHFLGGEELDSVMNYTLRDDILAYTNGQISAAEFAARQISRMENYPPSAQKGCFNCIGSHDRERLLTLLGSTQAVKFATTLQFALPGVPVIYYGDEAALEGGKDPDNRRTFPWDKEPALFDHFNSLCRLRNASESLKNGALRAFEDRDGKLIIERGIGAETVRFEFEQRTLKCEIIKKNSING